MLLATIQTNLGQNNKTITYFIWGKSQRKQTTLDPGNLNFEQLKKNSQIIFYNQLNTKFQILDKLQRITYGLKKTA